MAHRLSLRFLGKWQALAAAIVFCAAAVVALEVSFYAIGNAVVLVTLGVLFLFVAPIIVLIWSVILAATHNRRAFWLAAAIVGLAGAYQGVSPWLNEIGRDLTFQTRRATYDAIVADAKAGVLPPGEGKRYGLPYKWTPGSPLRIEFEWLNLPNYQWAGVFYCECGEVKPGYKSLGLQLDEHYTFDSYIF